MRMTLKKFSADPKHQIKKAPIVILINKEPSYAIIPYVVYKMKYQEAEPTQATDQVQVQDLHENTVTKHMATALSPRVPHSRLWRLLFE